MANLEGLTVRERAPRERQLLDEAQQNSDYYHEHMQEIWKEHNGQIAFVYGGGTVESFHCLEDFADWLESLPAESRQSGMSFQRPKDGIWIL